MKVKSQSMIISMAESAKVKKYLAYWFQLGKKIIIPSQNTAILPSKILNGHGYANEFEECWQLVTDENTGDCYLEGTSQTIQQLLSSQWDITECLRCSMPVPMIDVGIQNSSCVCNDMDNWPNNELPYPRQPINNQENLKRISESLKQKKISKNDIIFK